MILQIKWLTRKTWDKVVHQRDREKRVKKSNIKWRILKRRDSYLLDSRMVTRSYEQLPGRHSPNCGEMKWM